MKSTTLLFALSAAACATAQAAITFSVSGNSMGTQYGYHVGQAVTFSFTLDETFQGAGSSYFFPTESYWRDLGNLGQVWSSVTGAGLTGSYTRPEDPNSIIALGLLYSDTGDELSVQAAALSRENDIGLFLPSGDAISYIRFDSVLPVTAFANPVAYVDPTLYFADYFGSYSLTNGYLILSPVNVSTDTGITFSINNVSIIPEPSAYAMLFGSLSLIAASARRRRKI